MANTKPPTEINCAKMNAATKPPTRLPRPPITHTKKVMGPGSFDLAFKLGKGDFKPFKDGLVKGAEITKSKITFISDTPESLEWTSEAGTSKTYSFRLSLKAGKDEYTCYTVSPRESEAEYKAHKEACSTLMKKADAKK